MTFGIPCCQGKLTTKMSRNERAKMKREWNVGELLSVSSAYWRGCTLQAGVRLGIFTIIGKVQLTLEEISEKAETDPRATGFLLNGLAAMGLLEKKDNLYNNSTVAENHLSKDSPRYMGHIILHHHHILDDGPSWTAQSKVANLLKNRE